MKKGKPDKNARGARSVVLVFGENEHDTKAIRHLVEGLRPDLRGTVEPRRQPLVLIKGATQDTARDSAKRIAQVAQQESEVRKVLAVLAHQDCDAVEPTHVAAATRIEDELRVARCPGEVIAVAPAWELEAWWMIFPEAVGKIVEGWRDPDDWIGRDVGKVENAKEKLAHAVRPRPKKYPPPRPYEEHDSIQIAHNVAEDGLLPSFQRGCRESHTDHGRPKVTRCASFDAFRVRVLAIPSPEQTGRRSTKR